MRLDLNASPLVTDLYQLNMAEAYLADGENDTAVFEFFVRRLPASRNFLVAAGLEQVLDFLENLHFTPEDIDRLAATGRFTPRLLDWLADLSFTGDVHALAEGTIVFPDEPLLRVTAPLPVAQLVETRLINFLHFETLVASKAARMVIAAGGRPLIDFGLRRAHGAEAGVLAARASYLVGFAGTATVAAETLYGIPAFGTMAHSYVQAHDDETTAFERFARARPEGLTLLLDTYDTEAATRKVVALAPRLTADGIRIASVRLDSGDLAALSRRVRATLDTGGLGDVAIFVSGGLDELSITALLAAGAPVDGFGVGTSLTTSSDAPTLDCAYKLQEYAGTPRRKRSAGKATWPGRKQVCRRYGVDGRMKEDTLALEEDIREDAGLLRLTMSRGKRVGPHPTLSDIREHAARELRSLPDALRRLEPAPAYPVHIDEGVRRLADEADRRTGVALEGADA